MSVPVPLGVRIYNNRYPGFDVRVTRAVDDITFRSVAPGGFASATIRLHRPSITATPGSYLYGSDHTAFDRLARLFNRVQIFSLATAEIVWEGRVEDPRRSSADDIWELGCLGSMVSASDIQRPMFYVDSSLDSWIQQEEYFWQFQRNDDATSFEVRWEGGLVWPGVAGSGFNLFTALTHARAHECGLWLGRYDITFQSTAPSGAGNQAPTHLWNSVVMRHQWSPDTTEGLTGELDATNYTENVRRTRIIGLTTALNDNAFFEEDIDGWVPLNVTIAHSTAVVHPDGDGSLRITPDGVSAQGGAGSGNTPLNTVRAGQNYTASMQANLSAGTVTAHVLVNWVDASGAFISSSLSGGTALVVGTWTNVSATFTAPANAAMAAVWAWHSGTPTAGEVWYAWRVRLQAAANNFNIVGGFTAKTMRAIEVEMGVGNVAGFGDYTSAADKVVGRIKSPRVQAQRVDRTGTPLTDPGDYPTEYVTIPQVVEDVLGRLLVVGWGHGPNAPPPPSPGRPFLGQVRSSDAYIDDSSTAQITHLAWFDGVTAAQILDELMAAQPGAYWAIWESRYGATNSVGSDRGFRFEWATWPQGWGYQATSADGLDEQPSGEGLQNFIFYKWTDSDDGRKNLAATWDGTLTSATFGTADGYFQDLKYGAVTRAVTVLKEEPVSSLPSNEARDVLRTFGRSTNRGSLTVRRPIPFYDAGADSWSGAWRMCQPWEIRPGKLIRITDVQPHGRMDDFSHGTTAPPIEHDGTVFRVVSTEYSSAENACVLELDQVQAWQVATQITAAQPAPAAQVRKG